MVPSGIISETGAGKLGEFTVTCIQFAAIDGAKLTVVDAARWRYRMLTQRRPELYGSNGLSRAVRAAAE